MTARGVLLWLAIAAGLSAPVPARAQVEATPDQALRQEYFVRQEVNEALLIRINGFEAEFESRVFAPERELLAEAGIPGNRQGPVFHYMGATSKARQLDIELVASSHTNRSRFDVELSRLTIRDDRSERLAQAYRYLSYGMQASSDDTAANWSVKINSLLNAAGIFEGFGMEEMRLWSLYYAAFLAHQELGDHNTALGFTEQVLTGVRLMRFREIELAAVQLEGSALAGLRNTGALPPPASPPDPVQSMLERAAGLAATMGLQLERAWALYTSGRDFSGRSLYPDALARFEVALQIAESLEAGDLATLIREDLLKVHEVYGDVTASSEVLQEIEDQLSGAGAGEELAENLLSQGRLFNRTFRFPAAIEVLNRALEHERNSVVRAQANLALAQAHYESGHLQLARNHARAAVVNPQTGKYRRPNPVIDVNAGLDILAGVHRARDEVDALNELREAQREYREGQASVAARLYQLGLDALAPGVRDRGRAATLFGQSLRAAGSGEARWRHLAQLQVCALKAGQGECAAAESQRAHDLLQSAGLPRAAAEAGRLLAEIHTNAGRHRQALEVLDGLVDELLFLRRALPGVLGAWYWQQREAVFSSYLVLLGRLSRDGTDGFSSLLGLSKIRRIESTAGQEHRPWQRDAAMDAEALRVMLARLEYRVPGESVEGLAGTVNGQLVRGRAAFADAGEYLTAAGLREHLAGLTDEQAVLTYHLAPGTGDALVIIAAQGTVRRLALARTGELRTLLDTARQQFPVLRGAAFDRLAEQLGTRLLRPVAPYLPDTVYLVPAGPLLGIPLDALRLDGHYLVERHHVVHLLDFPVAPGPTRVLSREDLSNVFLAGDPSDWSGDYLNRLQPGPELRAVTDIFVGPGLHIVQGGALLPDEFEAPRFLDSDLVHLAMPGYIELGTPANSSLELSEPGRGRGRSRLGQEHIYDWSLQARLTVLSSTRLGGTALSAQDTRLGLVGDLLQAGSDAVIASLWESSTGESLALTADFYRQLGTADSVATALYAAKRHQLDAGEGDSRDWARLQLYIR